MKIHAFVYLSTAFFFAACGIKNTSKQDVDDATGSYETIDESYMNKSISPQKDFFEYANGTWCQNNPVPSSESRWGSFNELDKANNVKLLNILQKASQNPGASAQNSMLGNYYLSFMDFKSRNNAGLSAIEEEMNLVNELKDKKDLSTVIAKLQKNGISSLFYFGIGQDMKNVTMNVANFYQGGLGLPNKGYYEDKDKVEIFNAYLEHLQAMFALNGAQDGESYEFAADVAKFETMLAESMMSPAEQRQPELTYNKMEYALVDRLFRQFNFSKYLKELGLPQVDSIVVGQPEVLNQIAAMVENISLEQWKNYLKWNVINHYAGHLSQEFTQKNFDFYGKVLSGQKEMKPLEDQVVDEITNMPFNELLGKAFVEENFSASAQKRVNEMVDNLLAVYAERIQNLSWMSETTKKEALNKLNSIGRKLGFPSKWKDYGDLKFNSKMYVDNVRKANQFAVQENFSKLGKLVDKDEWEMPAHMVNAYYHPLLNEIAFPAGIMQKPFFSDEYEDAVNYGRIGMVIGHEFTHGFDDMGSKFAADGSFTNWWTETDRKAFEDKTGIFGQTFSAFCPIENHCVNPELTMGENIADLGGLTMA
jgi:putative endopeptidase